VIRDLLATKVQQVIKVLQVIRALRVIKDQLETRVPMERWG
jgi:hypothetical protein